MFSRIKYMLLAILPVLLLISCFQSTAMPEETEPNTLTVGIMPDIDSIPFIVAKQQGFLPDYITLEIFKSPVDRDSALFSGNLDGAVSDVLAVALAQNGGFDAFAVSKTNGSYAVLAGKNSGITSAVQLEGKRIALSVNTIIEYVTDRVIEESGGNPDKVEKTAVPKIPARLELLESGRIDAIAVPEPYAAAAVKNGAEMLGASPELNINPAVMMFTGTALTDKKIELIALYGAYDKAVEFINSNDKSIFMPSVIADLGLPESAYDVALPVYEKMSLPDEDEVNKAVDWLFAKGLIDKKFEYGDLVREIYD